MPNWCSNYATFQGDEAKVNELISMFRDAEEKQNKNIIQGYMPEFITEVKDSYFFDIFVQDDGQVSYETKWGSNSQDLLNVVKHLGGISFEVEYSESMAEVYGKDTYNHGTNEFKKTYLTHEDYALITEIDEDNIHEHTTEHNIELISSYLFENEYYDSKEDILDILLERKINQSNQ